LVRAEVPWSAPTNYSHPALVFAFGFATDEVIEPDQFFDAFTVTLRNADRSFVAPIVTADLFGIILAPESPDGAQLQPEGFVPETLVFPTNAGSFRFQQAYLLMFVMPPDLIGRTGTVGLTLFDNLNSRRSMAFLNHLSIVPGPGTFMILESSAAAQGPYALEGAISIGHARRQITLPRPGAHRFYRLKASEPTHIASMQPLGTDWLFHFEGAESGFPPVLQSSAQAAGPFAVESGVLHNQAAKTLRIRTDSAARFFRLRSELPLILGAPSMESNRMQITYEDPHP
jgi:hypothetical protein